MSARAASPAMVALALALVLAPAFCAAAGPRPLVASAADQAPPLFEVELASPSYGGAAVADLTGDGRPEIVFGTYYRDERVLALRADGGTLWEVPTGGGPMDNSITLADLDGDGRPEVVWGNSGTTVLHVADAGGRDLWRRTIGEVLDAPKAVVDLDGDGTLDLLVASCGASGRPGGLRAFVGSSGRQLWTADVGGCYQSAPLVFDQDGDGLPDIVVSTWFDDKVRAFSGRDGRLRWEARIGGWTYHAGAFGDLDGDGVPDVALSDRAATLWALDGASGAVLWQRALAGERYVFGPTAIGDVDGDGEVEVISAADRLHVHGADGALELELDLPGYCTRGPVLADVDDDGVPDIVLGLYGPRLLVVRGRDGAVIYDRAFSPRAAMDFQPALADLDGDGALDAFVVYGRGQSDTPELNWGRAVAVPLGGRGPGWPTFGHDHHHSSNYAWPTGAGVNPTPIPTAAPTSPGTPAAPPTATAGRPTTIPTPAVTVVFLPRAEGGPAAGAAGGS